MKLHTQRERGRVIAERRARVSIELPPCAAGEFIENTEALHHRHHDHHTLYTSHTLRDENMFCPTSFVLFYASPRSTRVDPPLSELISVERERERGGIGRRMLRAKSWIASRKARRAHERTDERTIGTNGSGNDNNLTVLKTLAKITDSCAERDKVAIFFKGFRTARRWANFANFCGRCWPSVSA